MKPAWRRAAEYADLELDTKQCDRLERYASWLVTEGHAAGGIGPSETERVDRRHIADSLLFAAQFPDNPEEVWDLGSGIGLPGIPLAIVLPETRFLLIDRSGRRVDLMKRAVRILELENCQVIHGDIGDLEGRVEVLVSRAALPPDLTREIAQRHLASPGIAIMAGSWVEPPDHPGWLTIEIPSDVLDQPVWLLIMRRE